MSQIEVSIRPPPRRTSFVSGFPGIPPCPSRPQAIIRGVVELRIPPEGVRAKWVKIELHRVERIPSSVCGSETRFEDCVGPGSVTLWSSTNEYTTLTTQQFPFSIRIPESLPPSVNMEDNAGIGYELEASVCVAVKAHFIPLSRPMVIKSTSPITIDKHELHSVWPVYLQPESRSTTIKGFMLRVERTQKCYGPGDRITVTATVNSDNDESTAVLQEFEISLIEVTTFRAGRLQPTKTNENVISSGEVALNATLCRGVSYSAELSCTLPSTHATTSLYSARHIDVTHTLSVKATMDNGVRLNIDLPVVISNWKSDVSDAALKRIGTIPRLCLSEIPEKASPPSAGIKTPPAKIVPNRHKATKKKNPSIHNTHRINSTVVIISREVSHPESASTSNSTWTAPSTSSASSNTEKVPEPLRNEVDPWLKCSTVEEEKRLYEQARQRVVDIQGVRHAPPPILIPKPLPMAPIQQQSSLSLSSEYASASASTTSHPNNQIFLSPQDEKCEKGTLIGGVSREDGEDAQSPPEYFKLFPSSRTGYLSDIKGISPME
ncbi:hypothetical protein CVT24_012154 [Panaeolus cyanescens]|uniref:Arrestin C-terminal-like domain-containing protein n=1 Tax=Panaeolus cyanescens TaxID=181874 RepID=A0A409YIU4_9AGAR|nr:hypothetical protein CVT24_012154 [Panaeolus cyanescens]